MCARACVRSIALTIQSVRHVSEIEPSNKWFDKNRWKHVNICESEFLNAFIQFYFVILVLNTNEMNHSIFIEIHPRFVRIFNRLGSKFNIGIIRWEMQAERNTIQTN